MKSAPPPLYRLSHNQLKELKKFFEGIHIVIIDEISMVSRRTLEFVSHRLGSATGREEVPFGGLTVIVCGDLFQLEPVGKSESESFTSHLWGNFELHELFGNERIKDIEWADMHTRLREHHPLHPKLTEADVTLLNSRCSGSRPSNPDTLHLFCVNKAAKAHDDDMFTRVSRGKNNSHSMEHRRRTDGAGQSTCSCSAAKPHIRHALLKDWRDTNISEFDTRPARYVDTDNR